MGSYAFLTIELLVCDETSYVNYLRMYEPKFEEILGLIRSGITKIDTGMRAAISPAAKLAVTLRFLATGESYQSLNYQTRLSTAFISNTIPEVCRAVYTNLKGENLKFPRNHNTVRHSAGYGLKPSFFEKLGRIKKTNFSVFLGWRF